MKTLNKILFYIVAIPLFISLIVFALLFMLLGISDKNSSAWKTALALDQTGNAIFGGSEDETISSRLGRNIVRGDNGKLKWRLTLCKFLSWLDPRKGNHCEESIGE